VAEGAANDPSTPPTTPEEEEEEEWREDEVPIWRMGRVVPGET